MSDLTANVAFDNASKAYELQTRRIEVGAEAVLKLAKSANVNEHTRGTAILNDARGLGLHELENQLKRFYAVRGQRERAAKRLADLGRALSHYSLGHRIPDVQRYPMWAAFRVLSTMVSQSSISGWFTTPAPEGSDDPANWIGRTTSGAPCQVELSSVNNVGDLLGYQADHATKVIVRQGSAPHRASMAAMAELDAVHAADVERLTKEIAAIESGAMDALKPHDLLKLSDPAPQF